jgi:outer membrane immunogenic protein
MLRTLLASTTAGGIALIAMPALAAGPVPVVQEPIVMAPMPVGTDWTGAYVGAQLGWGWATGELDLNLGSDIDNPDLDGNGVIGGFSGGYRYDFGQWVVGGEIQYDWASIDFDNVNVNVPGGSVNVEVDDITLNSVWRAKALAGYDLGTSLLYGSFGYAHATADFDGDDLDGDGWVIGAGWDYLIRENLTIGGELMYHQFNDFGSKGTDLNATTLQAKMTYSF